MRSLRQLAWTALAVTMGSACSDTRQSADPNLQASADNSAIASNTVPAVQASAAGRGVGIGVDAAPTIIGAAGTSGRGGLTAGSSAAVNSSNPSASMAAGSSAPTLGASGADASNQAGSSGTMSAAEDPQSEDEPAAVDPSAPLTAVAFYPSKGRADACADASVSIEFNRVPKIKGGGKIQIVEASGAVFDSVTAMPDDLYFSALSERTSGGKRFKSEVLDVVYNTVVFHPKAKLEYGKTYYVTVDEGMITDSDGTSFSVGQADDWSFTVRAQAPAAASTYTLAADGSGDYCSVEGALQALPSAGSAPRVIHIERGVYPGIVRMSQSNVHFVGAGMDKAVIAPKNCTTMNSSREGFVVSGSDVTFEDLSIFNTYLKDSNGQQAEALLVAEGSQRVFLKNVHLRSHQDTLRVDGSAYMEGGKISGSTDPLWGYGAFYCDGCELSSRTSGHAFVVARSRKGFGMVNCSVTREDPSVSKTYLAQFHSGSEPGKIAFVHCKIDSHIVGWRSAGGNDWYEYDNTSLSTGEPLKFDGKQLTAGSAELDALSSAQRWLGWSP